MPTLIQGVQRLQQLERVGDAHQGRKSAIMAKINDVDQARTSNPN